jgi:hypothetical protein
MLSCTLAGATERATIGPYVQNVQRDGFAVVFDTAVATTAEVRAGDQRVVTSGSHHEAVFHGLPAATRVAYRVFVDGIDVAGGTVRLLPDPTAPLTFVVYGDSRDGAPEAARIVDLARRLDPELILYTGDLTPHGADVQGWHDFFAVQAPLIADVPLYPTLGNHEIFRDPAATHFRERFILPDDGRARLYYRFQWGPATFLVLDGNAPNAAQTEWLRAALDDAVAAHAPHVFVVVHQPALSVGEHCGAALEQADWVALFERYRVRAVFAGHDHAYERLERNGVRYFVTGGAGAPLYRERPSCAPFDLAARRIYRSEHHLLRVRVDGTSVTVTALPLDEGPPLDDVRFTAGEAMFATDAPPLSPMPPTRPWLLAGGVVALALLGLGLRRRRA